MISEIWNHILVNPELLLVPNSGKLIVLYLLLKVRVCKLVQSFSSDILYFQRDHSQKVKQQKSGMILSFYTRGAWDTERGDGLQQVDGLGRVGSNVPSALIYSLQELGSLEDMALPWASPPGLQDRNGVWSEPGNAAPTQKCCCYQTSGRWLHPQQSLLVGSRCEERIGAVSFGLCPNTQHI